jgi:hypothetical protein
MHIRLLFLVIWQVPAIGWSEETTADPAQLKPARFRGLMALTPYAGMMAPPENNSSPDLDLISRFRLAWLGPGFCSTNQDRQLSRSSVSVKSG